MTKIALVSEWKFPLCQIQFAKQFRDTTKTAYFVAIIFTRY